jgi:hypothetical protein
MGGQDVARLWIKALFAWKDDKACQSVNHRVSHKTCWAKFVLDIIASKLAPSDTKCRWMLNVSH